MAIIATDFEFCRNLQKHIITLICMVLAFSLY